MDLLGAGAPIVQRQAVREYLSARLLLEGLRGRLRALGIRAAAEGRPLHRFHEPEARAHRRDLIAERLRGGRGYRLHA